MERNRLNKRLRKRYTCEIVAGLRRFAGIVIDVSSTGIFVQTHAALAPETLCEVHIASRRGVQEMCLTGVVARQKRADRRLVNLVAGGVGLHILEAPDAFYTQLAGCEPPAKPDAGAGAAGSGRTTHSGGSPAGPPRAAAGPARFQVRVSKVGTTRSRLLEIHSVGADEARQAALDLAGEGWQVLEVAAA